MTSCLLELGFHSAQRREKQPAAVARLHKEQALKGLNELHSFSVKCKAAQDELSAFSKGVLAASLQG